MPSKEGVKKMGFNFLQKQTSRREMLRGSATLAGSAFLAHFSPARLLRASAAGYVESPPSPAVLLASMRAKFNAVPMETQKLADNVTMFDGPGGAVTVLNGPDGKFVVDTFVAPAWPRLKEALDGLSNAPLKYVIDTHWHFGHTDNNAPLHAAGATVLAHENTKSACPSRMICRSWACISTPRPRRPYRSRPSPPVTSCKPIAKPSRSNTLLPRIRTSAFIFKRHISLHRPRYGRQYHRHDCRRRQNSLARRR